MFNIDFNQSQFIESIKIKNRGQLISPVFEKSKRKNNENFFMILLKTLEVHTEVFHRAYNIQFQLQNLLGQ